jgi:hypothetical protein
MFTAQIEQTALEYATNIKQTSNQLHCNVYRISIDSIYPALSYHKN